MTEQAATPAAESEPTKKQKHRVIKWLAISVGLFVLLVLVLLLTLYFVLRSGNLTQSAVPELKPYLSPLGIELKHIDSLRFDLLKSVDLQNLDMKWQDSNVGDVTLKIGEFKFAYSLVDLLDNRAEITELSLQNVHIVAHIHQEKPAPQQDKKEEKSSFDIAELEELLKSPPLILIANAINIKNISFDITLEQPDGVIKYQGELTKVDMELLWKPSQLKGKIDFALGQQAGNNRVSFDGKPNGKNLAVVASPALAFFAQWQLENKQNIWQLNNTKLDLSTVVSDVNLAQGKSDKREDVAGLKKIDVVLESQFGDQNVSSSATGLKGIFPLKVDSKITSELSGLSINNFQQPGLAASAQLNHGLNAKFKSLVDPFSQKIPNTQFNLEETLSIKQLNVKLNGQEIKTEKVDFTLNTQGDTLTDNDSTQLDASLKAKFSSSNINLNKPPTKQDKLGLSANLTPEIYLEAKANLASLNNPLDHLVADINPKIIIKQLSANLMEDKRKSNYKIVTSELDVVVDYDKQKIKLNTRLNLDKAKIPEIKKTFSLVHEANAETDLSLSSVNINTQLLLDKLKLFDAEIGLKNQSKVAKLTHEINLQLPLTLVDYHDSAKELEIVGEPHVSLQGESQVSHSGENIQVADFTLVDQWPFISEGSVSVTQKKPPLKYDGIVLTGPVDLAYHIDNKQNYNVNLDLNVVGVKMPLLEKALPLHISTKNNLSWPLNKTMTDTSIHIDGQKALNLTLTAIDKKSFFDLKSHLFVHATPEWQLYLKDLKELENLGVTNADLVLDVKLKHPFTSMMEFDAEKLEKVSAKLNSQLEFSQNLSSPGTKLVLKQPIKFDQTLDWSADKLSLQSEIKLVEVLLPNIAELSAINTSLQLNANSGLTPDSADIRMDVDKGEIKLLSTESETPDLDLGHVVTPMKLESSANWSDTELLLEKFRVNLGKDLLSLDMTGKATLDGKNAQIESKISSQLREGLFEQPKVAGAGSVQIPLRLTLIDGKQIAIEGDMQFNQLNIVMDDFSINNLNGSFSLEEEILVENERVKFRYLLNPNPFQRVDFTRVQPYLNTSSISIDKIIIGDKQLGPVLASVMLKQNMFSLQQFDVDLFSGHSAGQFYLDVRPGGWKTGLLSRITNLDVRQMLSKESKMRNSSLSPINSRTAFEFDIHKRLMEGEIVVSQISRDQLLQLLDVIDPSHEDEQMAQLRKGLRFSHPESVQVDMARGLMNLKVEVAGLPKAIKVTGLPLTPMIQQFASEALESIDKLPLE